MESPLIRSFIHRIIGIKRRVEGGTTQLRMMSTLILIRRLLHILQNEQSNKLTAISTQCWLTRKLDFEKFYSQRREMIRIWIELRHVLLWHVGLRFDRFAYRVPWEVPVYFNANAQYSEFLAEILFHL